MLQSSRLVRSARHPHQLPSQKLHHPQQTLCSIPTFKSRATSTQSCKVSRRELAILTNSSLLLIVSSQALLPNSLAEGQTLPEETNNGNDATNSSVNGSDQVPESPAAEDNVLQSETTAETIPPSEVSQSTETGEETSSSPVKEEPTLEISNNSNEIKQEPVTATKRAFLDISIDGKPMGRITLAIDKEKTPIAASRFIDLVSGRAGISYRRKEFVKITPNYVQHGGVRSYGVDAEMARSTGNKDLSNGDLIQEWEKMISESPPGTKNLAGSLGIIVRDPRKPPPKTKLVARQGKLKVEEEEVGIEPNGTEFVIAAKDSPELDDSALVVGRVIEGMDVVHKIEQVKTVQENTNSPYFRVAKLIGDKRAVVAERGFNRPYSKVVVTNCGILD